MSETNSQLDLASMKDPDGERIRQCLQKLSDKIERLENERRVSRMKVESLGETRDHTSAEVVELFHRLAKAEARCKVLQQQLSHVRKLVREATISNTDDLSLCSFKSDEEKSARLSNRSTNWESLSSASLDDLVLHEPAKNTQIKSKNRECKSTPSVSDFLHSTHSSRNKRHTSPPASLLDVPVYNRFLPSSNSTATSLIETLPRVEQNGRPNEVILNSGRKAPPTKQESRNRVANGISPGLHFEKEFASKHITSVMAETEVPPPRECQRKTAPSSNASYASTEDLSLPSNRLPRQRHRQRSSSRQRHRSSSQQRSGATTPLGRFLTTPQNNDYSMSHYHVKMHDIPFCSTTTGGKTHSLGANLQNLMSMVKVCHPALCNAAPLHKRRTRSSERSPVQLISTRPNMTKWNSTSELNPSHRPRARRSRSRSVDCYSRNRVSPCEMDDLDLIPVKLKPRAENPVQLKPVESCETPGNVCIRTEIKPRPAGCNKVVEVKMTTSTKPKCDFKGDTAIKRRQLLKNVREIQYMVENDQFE